jgi:hypothetical protein
METKTFVNGFESWAETHHEIALEIERLVQDEDSCPILLQDIEKYGIEYFTREVIQLCDSKFDMKYSELQFQLLSNSLLDNRFYNGIINIRLCSPKNYVDKPRSIGMLNL